MGRDNTISWAGYKKRQRAKGNSKAGSEADPISYLEAAITDSKLFLKLFLYDNNIRYTANAQYELNDIDQLDAF